METTVDGFLDGRLRIRQPAKGYRAGVDPVLLAAAVHARSGDHVLDLGCGVGVAALCLGARVPDLTLSGVEIQPDYAALAQQNAVENGVAVTVTTGDISQMPPALLAQNFDHVIANPPYFRDSAGTSAADPGRARAFGDAAPLSMWIDAGLRRLRPGGRITVIQRMERVPEIIAALTARAGDIWLMPIAGREGRAPERALLTAVKTARGPFRITAPFVMHKGAEHGQDGDDYTDLARQVLRGASPITWAFAA